MFSGTSGEPTLGACPGKGDISPSPWLAFSLDFQRVTEVFRAMPTYEYRCPNGHLFELFQKMSEEPRAECPECGAVSERLLSAGAGFLFKGDGFYITEHRSDSYRKEASEDSSMGAAAAGVESGAGKSDTAGSTKAESKASGSDSGSGGDSPSEGS